VREVLNYVQFSADALVTRLRRDVETALREGRLGYEESGRLLKFYEEGLHGYTYLRMCTSSRGERRSRRQSDRANNPAPRRGHGQNSGREPDAGIVECARR
jgi:hypothetical protein